MIYQIWPRSFNDSNSDGIGDLEGIRQRLDYLSDGRGGGLGVDAIWISPFFASPLVDYGYDIADYVDVDPSFGTLGDFDRLLADAHARSIRVVLDLVPNHSSDQHRWFIESRSNRTNPRRDWYVWRDPADDGGPPNNWHSAFPEVGSAWSLDQMTSQYYLHSYTPNQPDLNWENPEVREAMKGVMRFWLDRGVDGFRIDVVHRLAKDPGYRNNPADLTEPEPSGQGRRHDADWHTIDERLRELRDVADEYKDVLLVGEVYILDQSRLVSYLGPSRLHLGHNFVFLNQSWEAKAMARTVDEFESLAGGVVEGSWCLNNHDHSRAVSRFGDHGDQKARAAALLLLGLRGTAFIYQGEELGLPDSEVPSERIVDVDGRDPCRTPMPWEAPSRVGPGAGFSTGVPWLPIGDSAEELNAADENEDPTSMLSLYRRLIHVRNQTPALRSGSYAFLGCEGEVLKFVRSREGERVYVLINFGPNVEPAELPAPTQHVEILATSVVQPHPSRLNPYEARWVKQVSPQKNS